MDHVTNIHGEFRKADIHLGASCSSSFCLLNHYHTAHVLCIALNLSLPVATHGHEPSKYKRKGENHFEKSARRLYVQYCEFEVQRIVLWYVEEIRIRP